MKPEVSRNVRRKLAGFALAGTLVFFSSFAAAAVWDVRPTGDASKDIAAIQAAIDRAHPGDTIRLKATSAAGQFTPFNLGNPTPTARGTILVNKRLTITGELYRSPMSDRTVIKGGFATFYVDTLDPRTGRVDGPVSFTTLESRQAVYSFIDCKACSGACITDVNIYDPVPALPDALAPSGVVQAINFATTHPLPGYAPDKINGEILVRRCTVDCSNSAEGGASDAIIFADHVAKVSVSDCRTINFSFHGIVNLPAASEQDVSRGGACDVQGCEVTTRRTFYGGLGYAITFGIVGSTVAGPLSISNNRVLIDTSGFGKDFQAIGIEANGDTGGGSIENNHVTITNATNELPPASGFSFLVGSDFLKFSGNVLSGIANVGFFVGSDSASIVGNDLTGLTTTAWAVWCWGANSSVIEKNAFGPQYDPKMPAIYCEGNGNAFNHNDFSWTGLKGFEVSSTGISRAGCIFLEYGTSGNVVNASLSELPQGSSASYDPCTQIADGSFGVPPGNTINLDFPCDSNHYSQLIHMLNQYADYRAMRLP